MPHFIDPGTRKVWTSHGVVINDTRGSNMADVAHVVYRDGFEVSLMFTTNNSLGFVIKFIYGDLFLG